MRVDIRPGPAAGFVKFSCQIGDGVGRWSGGEECSEGRFDVEFDVGLPVRWPAIEVLEPPVIDHLEVSSVDPLLVDVVGQVMDCDEAGVLSLAIGLTNLLLDTEGDPILEVVGQRVRVTGLAFELFPYEF